MNIKIAQAHEYSKEQRSPPSSLLFLYSFLCRLPLSLSFYFELLHLELDLNWTQTNTGFLRRTSTSTVVALSMYNAKHYVRVLPLIVPLSVLRWSSLR